MSVELNHTIVAAKDRRESAEFLARVLGLEVGPELGPFLPVQTANGVTLDFATVPEEHITRQHYAFLVSEAEFDAAFERIRQEDIPYWADPHQERPGEINRNDGGRGLYFLDPSGHAMEILTRPYGSGGDPAS
ncbi:MULTISPECIES: VOC family protein [Streptomyces]|uniref:VOC family protein n=1 Tax=Streptomyces sudanensis TaxID=436397 RepID=A0ABY4TDC8_9ACTN|nr:MULTISPECIES: VOC family protein [Streptomyces]MCP9958121.1 VOC family protein [Streptomyces sudanensis]MCP9987232.1 VOC family protein [Streptomyces sudanensis]MCQ0001357.1 VOC family protein [Streptomyces sudanensis]URN16956.1 VOC family protein [Streptomyces sudanensis]